MYAYILLYKYIELCILCMCIHKHTHTFWKRETYFQIELRVILMQVFVLNSHLDGHESQNAKNKSGKSVLSIFK